MSKDLLNFDPQEMMNEYYSLKKELDRYDILYDQVFDEITTSKGRSKIPYVFISSQYTNLTTILNHRQSVISKLFDMRKTIEDIKIKYITMNNKEEEDSNDTRFIIKDLLRMLSDKSIPYQDLERITEINDQSSEGDILASNPDSIADQLDNLFEVNDEGLVVDRLTEENLIHKFNDRMKELEIKIDHDPDSMDIFLVEVINYNDEDINVPYDHTQLEEDDDDLLVFLNNDNNFYIDEDKLVVPEGFTEFI